MIVIIVKMYYVDVKLHATVIVNLFKQRYLYYKFNI